MTVEQDVSRIQRRYFFTVVIMGSMTSAVGIALSIFFILFSCIKGSRLALKLFFIFVLSFNFILLYIFSYPLQFIFDFFCIHTSPPTLGHPLALLLFHHIFLYSLRLYQFYLILLLLSSYLGVRYTF